MASIYRLLVDRKKVMSLYCTSWFIFANEELNIAIQIVDNRKVKSFPL